MQYVTLLYSENKCLEIQKYKLKKAFCKSLTIGDLQNALLLLSNNGLVNYVFNLTIFLDSSLHLHYPKYSNFRW